MKYDRIMTVVGNAELSDADRELIRRSSNVIRFNDMNYLRLGEKTTTHVIRFPSASHSRVKINAVDFYIVPCVSYLPRPHTNFSVMCETGYDCCKINRTGRVFPSCHSCGHRCLYNETYAGPSTGAIVLSMLQESDAIDTIVVLGMNWMGSPLVHIDFKHRGIVKECCSKCVIHRTKNSLYGNEIPAFLLLPCAFVPFLIIVCFYKRWLQ